MAFFTLKTLLIEPFCTGTRLHKPLLGLFCLINSLVLFNALFHFHRVGYDTLDGHMPYIAALGTFHLPDAETSRSFFSPPLPYVFPALVHFLLTSITSFTGWDTLSLDIACKAGQMQNVVFSLGLTFALLKICNTLYPDDIWFKFGALALLGIVPVYYKSFAFVRGEPLVAFLALVVIYQVCKLLFAQYVLYSRTSFILPGLTLGLLALSRQWGILLFPALAFWVLLLRVYQGRQSGALGRTVLQSLCLAILIGGWFYVVLAWRYGSPLAFNRDPSPIFRFSNQPATFYTGIGLDQLFRAPVYPAFANQLIPVFFSETWGDYWAHFVYTRSHTIFASDNGVSLNYLGRVNFVSLVPTIVLTGGMITGCVHMLRFIRPSNRVSSDLAESLERKDMLNRHAFFGLLVISILISLGSYIWFLIGYPNPRGDTVKATYMLHIFPLLAILASEFLRQVRSRSVALYWLLMGLLLLVFLHNLPVVITRFITPLPFLYDR